MYFINSVNLRKDLLENKVSQRDYFIYFFLSGTPLFQTIVIDLRFGEQFRDSKNIIVGLSAILGMLVLIRLYRLNEKIDNIHFLERFFSINWVVRFKLFFILWIPFLLGNLLLKRLLDMSLAQYLLISNILSFIDVFVYYLLAER